MAEDVAARLCTQVLSQVLSSGAKLVHLEEVKYTIVKFVGGSYGGGPPVGLFKTSWCYKRSLSHYRLLYSMRRKLSIGGVDSPSGYLSLTLRHVLDGVSALQQAVTFPG